MPELALPEVLKVKNESLELFWGLVSLLREEIGDRVDVHGEAGWAVWPASSSLVGVATNEACLRERHGVLLEPRIFRASASPHGLLEWVCRVVRP